MPTITSKEIILSYTPYIVLSPLSIYALPFPQYGTVEILILGWIFRRWDVGIWTGLGWPRIETGGRRL